VRRDLFRRTPDHHGSPSTKWPVLLAARRHARQLVAWKPVGVEPARRGLHSSPGPDLSPSAGDEFTGKRWPRQRRVPYATAPPERCGWLIGGQNQNDHRNHRPAAAGPPLAARQGTHQRRPGALTESAIQAEPDAVALVCDGASFGKSPRDAAGDVPGSVAKLCSTKVGASLAGRSRGH
jgi:hypothetical protein